MNGIRKFMSGRYGWDILNWVLVALAVFCTFTARFTNNMILAFVTYIPLVLCVFRTLSTRVTKRYDENYRFVHFFTNIGNFFVKKWNYLSESKYYLHLKCPSCKQKIKVPRHRGKLEITCPKCQTSFRVNSH